MVKNDTRRLKEAALDGPIRALQAKSRNSISY